MVWIWFIVIAQFINAIVALIDKYIVTKPGLPKPVVYAFYVNMLSAASLIVLVLGDALLPFLPTFESFALPRVTELTVPSVRMVIVSLLSGFLVLQALILLFKAFRQADASDVVPMVSALTAITSYILSHIIFDVAFSQNFLVAFVFLVVGTALISRFRCGARVVRLAVMSGILFGAHSVILKYIFETENFSDGFLWTRLAGVVAALSLLLFRSPRSRIFNQTKSGGTTSGLWVVGNKTLAGVAGILILAAISLGDIALINALNGLQFVFLILFTIILGRRTPSHVGEAVDHRGLIQKTCAVMLIVIGFFILFI